MSKMISDSYKEQLQLLHGSKRNWGGGGAKNFGDEIRSYLIKRPKYTTVLDFGAGQRKLGKFVTDDLQRRSRAKEIVWTDYDPGVVGIDRLPSGRFDLIVSSDVMEHIEPDMVEQTCEWLRDHATKAIYMHIATMPSGVILPYGRNAHLSCHKIAWWLDQLVGEGWQLMYYHDAWQVRRSGRRNHCHIMMEWPGGPKPDRMKYYSDDPARHGIESNPVPYVARYVPDFPLNHIDGRIIRNPNYGGAKAGIYGWCTNPKVSMGKKPMFKEALGESLLKEGYRNPVILFATETGNWLSFGGSRVDVGREVGMERVPAIVNDYCGRFDNCEEVTEENFKSFFTDIPRWHVIDELGVDYHYAIERKRRAEYDPAGHAWCTGKEPFLEIEFPWIGEGLTRDPEPRRVRSEKSKYLKRAAEALL